MVFSRFLAKMEQAFEDIIPGVERHSHTHVGHGCHEDDSHADYGNNRFCSFAPPSSGHAKWYIDGATYFWAVSKALEEAQESIYILDWWLSPELYLRRPPARNERYRLDVMLKAAAERGVKVYIIVYKEVEQALTLNSRHTKHHLEDMHTNIKVFRHPDHHPRGDFLSDLQASFKNLTMRTFDLAQASKDAVCALYGTYEDVILFWAHHEKLVVVDGKVAFMGGLDMCFGRWDTSTHPIADAHPGNLDEIVFPGQDYNNARIYDFEDVSNWENNKLDRTKSSRMGWSDITISLSGPIVNWLMDHFVDRWNFIFNEKYDAKDPGVYELLESPQGNHSSHDLFHGGHEFFEGVQRSFSRHAHSWFGGDEEEEEDTSRSVRPRPIDGAQIQLTRSACPWSAGHKTEHSVANAYIEAITNAKHFVYIENQFFITATSDEQKPVQNKIGRAIVDRILRAHNNGEDFQMVILMPAVPAFAGDLQSEGALGTRAIMEFQYYSINRGHYSIIEMLQKAGIEDPHRYINFYNLRNYDRINKSSAMSRVEEESGVPYEEARREYDDRYEGGWDGDEGGGYSQYYRYQAAARRLPEDAGYDSVAACYMESGLDLRSIPWSGGDPESEMDAYVSEELYIHSKVLIADDRLVICGSANINDRSQLGNHDSEIAVVIEDPTPVQSYMGGRPYTASAFAASLRRQLYRKHLGLLPHQPADGRLAHDPENWTPITEGGNVYDWGSRADELVQDPLDERFLDLWKGTARRNTEIFSRAFHAVPDDKVRTWDDYNEFFTKHFVLPGEDAKVAEEGYANGKVDYGHVVREEFPGGVEELKDWLSGVRGTLVEMPLQFLIDVEDLAQETLAFNGLTNELYT